MTHVTLFYWRHKILAALKQIPTNSFQGIVEMDETYFLYSEKGRRNISERKSRKRGGKAKYRGISNDQICVLVARDRQKMTFSGVLGRGRIRTTKLDEAIGGHLSDSNVPLYRFMAGIQFLRQLERFRPFPLQVRWENAC